MPFHMSAVPCQPVPGLSTGNPPAPDAHARGVQLYAAGRYSEALSALDEALRHSAMSAELWNDWAAANLACGDGVRAEKGFRMALALDWQNGDAAINLAALLVSQRCSSDALQFLRDMMPRLAEAHREVAERLLGASQGPGPGRTAGDAGDKPGTPAAMQTTRTEGRGSVKADEQPWQKTLTVVHRSPEAAGAPPITAAAGAPARPRITLARDLFSAGRMDFVVKELFFHSLATGVGREAAADLYSRHILARTGGAEPADFRGVPSDKSSMDGYFHAAEELFASMRDHGYDAAQPVPFGSDGLPLNGAHRVACAAALGCRVAVENCEAGGSLWDMPWFERAGFSKTDRLTILHRLVDLLPERAVVFMLWAPVIDHWDQLTRELSARIPVAGYVDLAWPVAEQPAFESLVYDIYSNVVQNLARDFGRIDRKLGFLREKPGFMRVGVCLAPAGEAFSVFGRIAALKAELREMVREVAPVDHFVTCHLSDSAAEALHMAHTLLSPANLAAARLRPSAKPRDTFLEWLSDYRNALAAADIDPEDCCIVGSSVLETIGLRLSTDIDFTLRKPLRDQRYGPGVTKFAPGLDIVTEGYHRVREGTAYTDDQIIDNPRLHVRFRGLKIVAPFIVRDRKDFSRRPKDCLDVELMDSVGHAGAALVFRGVGR